MPVPWQALLPLALIGGLFMGTAKLTDWIHRRSSNGKPPRYRLSPWGQFMVDRDEYITGDKNIQKVPYWSEKPVPVPKMPTAL